LTYFQIYGIISVSGEGSNPGRSRQVAESQQRQDAWTTETFGQ